MEDSTASPSVSVDPSGEHQEESSKMCDASRDISKEVPFSELYQDLESLPTPSVSVDPSGEHHEESSKMCDASRDPREEAACPEINQEISEIEYVYFGYAYVIALFC